MLTSGFYNSINHDRRYDADDFSRVFDGIISDGVYANYKQQFLVTVDDSSASFPDNTVVVKPGRAWFNGTWAYNDSDATITLDPPEPYAHRYDAIVLNIDRRRSARIATFVVVKGNPGDNDPPRASLIKEDGHWQYPLAWVARPAGQARVHTANITITVGNGDEGCPFVTGVVQQVSISDLLAQWSAEFRAWFNSTTSTFDADVSAAEQHIADERSAFDTYVNNTRNEIGSEKSSFLSWLQTNKTNILAEMESVEREFWQKLETHDREFVAWMEEEKRKYAAFLSHNYTAWTNWFSHIQYELDGDVAGHLQSQIDEIKKFTSIYVVDHCLFIPMSGASVIGKRLIFAKV